MLLTLERRGWQSLCDGTGAEFYSGLMTDDALMVLANGVIMDRAAAATTLAHTPPWAGFELTDARLRSVGAKSAALGYVGTGYRDGAPKFVGAMSSEYTRVGSGWKLALYEQTGLPSER